jgi:Type IV secretion-system coupling protein DNA-binding domain
VTTAAFLLAGGLGLIGLVLGGRYLDALVWRRSLVAFSLRLPTDLTTDNVARWLATVAAATHAARLALLPHPPVALEVVADRHGIRHMLLVSERMQATILSSLRASLPGVRLEDAPDYLKQRPRFRAAAEAVLTSHRRQMAIDRAEATATALLGTLQPLHSNDQAVVQWIFTGGGTPAPIPSTQRASSGNGSWWMADEPPDSEAVRAARLKQADAMLRASLRVGVVAPSRKRAYAVFGRVWGQHRGLNASGVLLVRRWWLSSRRVADRMSRFAVPITGWPLLLGSREAAGLLPLPVGKVALPGLVLGAARQLPPAPGMPKRGVQIGVSNYPGMGRPLRLTAEDRLRHLHIVGPTGTGKSTLLVNLVTQDIEAGHGVVVIDVLGDLTRNILARIPDKRADDVIVLDPSATDRPVGFNILQAAHDEQSRELVVDHVIHIWHELYREFWGPRTEDVLRGALLTLINTRAPDGSAFTLVEVPELLTNAKFRRYVLGQSGVPAALDSFWTWYQASDRLNVVGPILNKLRAATLRTSIRLMLGQSEGLDLPRILRERKVLLVPLNKGTNGAETAGLLGTVFLLILWQAILGRIAVSPAQRHPEYVYIDEAQDVLRLPLDLADMLAQARGLGAGLTLAHQYLGQVKDALVGTVRSQIVFQCGRTDAVELAKSFEPRLTAEDLMNLAAYEVAVRPCVNGQTIAPVTGTTLPLPDAEREPDALAEASSDRYGSPRTAVEEALKARITPPGDRERHGAKRSGSLDSGPTFGRRRKATSQDDQASGGQS